MKKEYLIVLFIFVLSCENTPKKDNVKKNKIELNNGDEIDTYSNLGLDSLFFTYSNFRIDNNDRDYLYKRINEKRNKTTKHLLKEQLVNNSEISNFPNDDDKIFYYPLAQIKISDSLKILFIEEYENKFPTLFKKVIALTYNVEEKKIKDNLIVYCDNDVCIFRYHEKSFSWDSKIGYTYTKERNNFQERGNFFIYKIKEEKYKIINYNFNKLETKEYIDSISLDKVPESLRK